MIILNKGSYSDVKNYRGITVLPVICKIIETIIKRRITPYVENTQNVTQRGFTSGSSPLNAAYILEEFVRECQDVRRPGYVVLLDAKSAFDVVDRAHLMRRLYHIGIDDAHWSLVNSLHFDNTSVVKIGNQLSEEFIVTQGVRQGGILSSDLYKLYVNPLLQQFSSCHHGGRMGDILCNNSACADDVCILSNKECDMQVLINLSLNFAAMERYQLQPTKSVSINLKTSRSMTENVEHIFEMGNEPLKNVNKTTHLGIIRTPSLRETVETNIENNIENARKKAYSLMGAGFHGNNGLDPQSCIMLYKVYILPVLLYGLELLSIIKKHIVILERFQKKMLKQILSLPDSTADPLLYILTGILPIEAQIHIKALGFFNNICVQSDTSIEKQILIRQLACKTVKSNSWAVSIQKLLMQYDLETPDHYLHCKYNQLQWKQKVQRVVIHHWKEKIEDSTSTYSTLQNVQCTFSVNKLHPILRTPCNNGLEVTRPPPRLWITAGKYIVQSTRAKFNQNAIDPTCPLCLEDSETIEHFLLDCIILDSVRQPILANIHYELQSVENLPSHWDRNNMLQLFIDFSKLLPYNKKTEATHQYTEFHIRRLVYTLHTQREKMLRSVLPRVSCTRQSVS